MQLTSVNLFFFWAGTATALLGLAYWIYCGVSDTREYFRSRDVDEKEWRLEHPEESATEPSWRSQDRKESTDIIGGIVVRTLAIGCAIFLWYCLIYAGQAVEIVHSLQPCK
jgi:hypothetical protein